MSYQFFIHYGFHFIVPLAVAYFFFSSNWKVVYLIFIATMLVDLDHLLADPIYDPNRCSIHFHPLHSYYAIAAYIVMLFPKKTRVIAIGLLLHMMADQLDCWL